jgi:hypothetical protein
MQLLQFIFKENNLVAEIQKQFFHRIKRSLSLP